MAIVSIRIKLQSVNRETEISLQNANKKILGVIPGQGKTALT